MISILMFVLALDQNWPLVILGILLMAYLPTYVEYKKANKK